jgi:hypothetical protein
MASVFSERATAIAPPPGGCEVALAAGETLRLGAHGGDLVIFLASGACGERFSTARERSC